MIEYILLAIIKIGDNIIQTAKSISTYQEKKILSSILTIISQLMFYLILLQMLILQVNMLEVLLEIIHLILMV